MNFQLHILLQCIYISTAFFMVESGSSPKYTWPLCDATYAFEVTGNNKKNQDNNQCGFYFEGEHADFNCKPLALNVADRPYVDIIIGDENQFDKFSLSISINPAIVSGVIYHYYSKETYTGDKVNEVLLCKVESEIEVTVKYGDSTPDNTVRTKNANLQNGLWYTITVVRVFDSGKIEIILGSTTLSVLPEDTDFPTKRKLKTPGTIRFGSSGFIGKMTCFLFNDYEFQAKEGNLIKDYCKKNKWSKTPKNIPNSPPDPCNVNPTIPPPTED